MDAIPDGVAQAAAGEVKAYLRIARGDEDAALARLAATALVLAEAFTGQVLVARDGVAELPVGRGWQKLLQAPLRSIAGVEGVTADGSATPIAVGDHAIDIDAAGDGWVRATAPGAATRLRVRFTAGLAADWAGLPEPVRQGVIVMAAHLHGERDGAVSAPPANVTALWRPWRRMRLFERGRG